MINGNCVFKTVEHANSLPSVEECPEIYFEKWGWFESLSGIDLETMPYPTLSFSDYGSINSEKFSKEFKNINPVDILGFKIESNGEFKGFAEAIVTDEDMDLLFLV